MCFPDVQANIAFVLQCDDVNVEVVYRMRDVSVQEKAALHHVMLTVARLIMHEQPDLIGFQAKVPLDDVFRRPLDVQQERKMSLCKISQ
jgi:hypothetical protein